MSRPLQIEYPGALYHLTARGNSRDDIFLDDDDRHGFLRMFGVFCSRISRIQRMILDGMMQLEVNELVKGYKLKN